MWLGIDPNVVETFSAQRFSEFDANVENGNVGIFTKPQAIKTTMVYAEKKVLTMTDGNAAKNKMAAFSTCLLSFYRHGGKSSDPPRAILLLC